jgi:hypothetical protein
MFSDTVTELRVTPVLARKPAPSVSRETAAGWGYRAEWAGGRAGREMAKRGPIQNDAIGVPVTGDSQAARAIPFLA